MAASEAQKRANAKWQKKVYRYKHVKLHIVNDKDILDRLDEITKEGQTINSYMKQLIRDDIEKQKPEQ